MNITEYIARNTAKPGVVYLVGSGPGDLGLLTMKAAALLSSCDVVVYDRLSSAQARGYCKPDATVVNVGKQPTRHTFSQEEINHLLVEYASQGKSVVRFKGGDPFVFGRGSEEALYCKQQGIPFEIIPGITSAISVPAYAGIPITHRGISRGFAVFTGHEDPHLDQVDYGSLSHFDGTIVLLMAVARIRGIADQLIASGKSPNTPVAMIRWGTLPVQTELTGTLETIADQVEATNFKPPAVTVIGPVVEFANDLNWFSSKPLFGKNVLVPRTRQDSSAVAALLEEKGANVLIAPTIKIVPPNDTSPLEQAVAALANPQTVAVSPSSKKTETAVTNPQTANGSTHFKSIVFTSRNAVRALFAEMKQQGYDARILAGITIGCVGPGTAHELTKFGITADHISPKATAKHTASYLLDLGIADPVLLPLADIASPILADRFTEAGLNVTRVEAYQTIPADQIDPNIVKRIYNGDVDAICCTSSSTIRNLVHLLDKPIPEQTKIVAIGPSTEATCKELGLTVAAVAKEFTIPGVLQATEHVLTSTD